MKSPFPGMDPYLEKRWRDFHARLVIYSCDQIEEFLPASLVARVEERVVFEIEEREHHRSPDFRLMEKKPLKMNGGTSTAVAEAVETGSFLVEIDAEPITETFIEILDIDTGQRVITAIEFMSMTNKKAGDGLDQYQKKQVEYRRGKVSLVEIDLLRSGRRDWVMPVSRFPPKARTTYQACVRRGWQPGLAEVFPIPLQLPLPKIKIPLREHEPGIWLDMQPLVEVAYRKGRYGDTIDYRQPPDSPLAGKDAKWAKELLKTARKR